MYYIAWGVALVVLFMAANVRDSRTGRAFFAVRGSEVGAASLGVDVTRYKLIAFTFSGFLAGVSGSLLAIDARALPPDTFQFTVSLFFLAGVVIIVGTLAAIDELAQVGGALQVIGLFVFLPRVASDLSPARWSESMSGLLARLAVVGLVVSVVLLVVLIQQLTSGADFPEFRPILLAYDHNNFLLVMTNIILGLMTAGSEISSRRNGWITAGVNIGAAGFVVALLVDSAGLKQIFTPILGVALLWAIWTHLTAAPREQMAEASP